MCNVRTVLQCFIVIWNIVFKSAVLETIHFHVINRGVLEGPLFWGIEIHVYTVYTQEHDAGGSLLTFQGLFLNVP